MAQGEQDFVLLEGKDVVDFNVEGLLPLSPKELQSVQNWLDPTNYNAESSEYNKHLASYANGTGQWIQNTEQYQKWLRSDGDTAGALWIKATAGAGKSVVAAHTASLLAEEGTPVLSFFFRQIIAKNRTPQSLVRDWLSQLLPYSPKLQKNLKEIIDNCRSLESVAFEELWELATSTMFTLKRIYCVVDALDEMNLENNQFMKRLVHLGRDGGSIIKLLITSRPLPYIASALDHSSVIELPLRPKLVDSDISIYVKSRLASTSFSDSSKQAIEKVLSKKSLGLFLYARLMLDEILQSGNTNDENIESILDHLPFGLGDMYTKMLQDHSARSGTPQDLQLLMLKCVTHSSRPLRLLELSSIVAFMRKKSPQDYLESNSARDTKSIVRNACGPLLEILEDETISIIHHSLTEFLTNPGRITSDTDINYLPEIASSDTHLEIAKFCVDYLLSDGLADWESIKDQKVAKMKHSFLDYAAHFWKFHVAKYEGSDDELFRLLDRLLQSGSTEFSAYLEFISAKGDSRKTSDLQIAVTAGLVPYSSHLLKLGREIEFKDRKSRTLMHRAAKKGHHKIVEILLAHGAASNPDDYCGLTPLHYAASRNHAEVVSLLLKVGVDPLTPKTREHPGNWCGNAPRSKGHTPLQYACSYGHLNAVNSFLPFIDEEGYRKALLWALDGYKSDTALAILATGKVDVNKAIGGKTPLHFAAHNHDFSVVKRLLSLGADVNIKSNNMFDKSGMRCIGMADRVKFSPLDGLVTGGSRDIWRPSSGQATQKEQNEMENMMAIIQMLLDAGCNINEYSPYGLTALQQIFSQGEELRWGDLGEFLKFMVSHGADPTLPTEDGTNVLHLMPPQESILVPLLELGLDVNCRDSKGRTIIFRGLHDEDTTRMLIKLGADCRVRDSKGNTTLHVTNSSAVMKVLLENGVPPDAKNNEGKTPLHGIRFETYTSTPTGKEEVEILITAGADLESKTHLGLTKLHMAVKGERELPGSRLLIEAGADPNCRDLDGRTPLFHLCDTVNDRTVATRFKELVKLGAHPHLRDFSGNSLFHQLAGQTSSYYDTAQLELFELVLELGVSPLSPNNAGQTPLHIALKKSVGSISSYKTNPVEFLLGPKCKADINASDAMGIRPIHEAVALSEQLVRYCLDNGADPLPVTSEGLNILHICSRTRQSNIVGLAIDLYQKMDQSELINQKDYTGKTPLHYAALSGRFESVSILLNMGNANPSLKDADEYTPLHMCALFEDEDLHWSKIQARTPLLGARTDGVLLTDVHRPVYSAQGTGYGARYAKGYGDKIDNEAQTVGVRQTIWSLVAHGADISFMFSDKLEKSRVGRSTPFSLALQHRSEAMIAELLSLSKRKSLGTGNLEKEASEDEDDLYWLHPWDEFSEKYCGLRSQNITQLVESLAKKGEGNHDLFNNLLKIESYEGIEVLKSLGSDMLNLPWGGEPTCIATLASSGYAYLLEKFSLEVLRMDDTWLSETEKSTPNAPGRLDHPFIFACRRNLPNFEVIKVMVEKIGIDVNMKSRKEGQTALHILAGNHYTNHWWHSHAMNYLLEHGADPNLKNNDGKTPLHLAVQNNERVVEVLLKHGADPNVLGPNDTSCLNFAKSNRVIVHQLIKNGVDISTGKWPFLFDCVDGMDASTINLLAEMGADFNVRVKPEEESDSDDDDQYGNIWATRSRLWRMMDKDDAKTSYPLHWAASHNFNTEEIKEGMLPVIQALLDGGADPMLPWNDSGDSVFHHTCEGWGILDPFMTLPDLKLESRDSKGRTLLLAAATTLKDFSVGHRQDNTWLYAQPSNVMMLLKTGADIMAVDNEGKNVLHHLLESGTEPSARANHPHDLERILATDAGEKLVTQKDKFGYTPLHRALLQHQPWAVEPLLSKGADPLEPDPEGNTALHHLATQLQTVWGIAAPIPTNLLQKFIDFGISINTQNSDGETPLFKLVAAEDKHREGYGQDNEALKHVDLLKMIEEKWGDISVKNKKGQGLLHSAAKAGDVETFKYLVGKGLDPRSEDVEGRSALDCAMASGSEEILGMFKREG